MNRNKVNNFGKEFKKWCRSRKSVSSQCKLYFAEGYQLLSNYQWTITLVCRASGQSQENEPFFSWIIRQDHNWTGRYVERQTSHLWKQTIWINNSNIIVSFKYLYLLRINKIFNKCLINFKRHSSFQKQNLEEAVFDYWLWIL